MKRVFLGIAVSGALVLATNVQAAGPYVTASVGQTKFDTEMTVEGSPGILDAKDSDTYLSLGFGYSFNQNFSFEAAYNQFGEGSDELGTDGVITLDLDTEVSSFSLALQGKVPVTDKFSIIGRAGFERWDADFKLSANQSSVKYDDDGSDFFYGIGFSYAISKELTLIAQYDIHELDASANIDNSDLDFEFDVDFDVLSLGMQFSF